MHDRNNVTEVFDFITENLGKVPRMAELRDSGLNDEQKEIFKSMFNAIEPGIEESEKKEEITKKSFGKLRGIQTLGIFLHKYGGYSYDDYSEIKYKNIVLKKQPSGTCMPFSKKIFVTANGLLLPCETVDHKYHLGKITEKEVVLDFNQIAEYYNDAFKSLAKKCEHCYINAACEQCMFNMDVSSKGDFVCKAYVGPRQFEKYLSKQMSQMESSPELYSEIAKNLSTE
jgi:uncharacterized protein